ncbi:uncharacterized protein UTRI_02439 [Ustilago trichophora]|uniref:Zinc-finger domain-containing protein n=1 Tax=Ustilago trichophora TaxID=86804 RepID=A0A5C3E639_9BASI|nr:uncharacterized protein UTRI_02439 [Ustilago trichophora]
MDDDDESLSELSDAAATSSSPANLAAKPQSKTKLAANGTPKPKARKSEPIPKSHSNGNVKHDEKEPSKSKPKVSDDGTPPKASSSRSTPISDVVRARTHVNCEGNPIKICHQHHQPCKGPLLECTFMRAPGKRCQGRYCFSSLKRFYDMDPETIVKSNRMMINPQEHCPPSETKYAWKCPRCRKKCACSTCRKAAGLEPLGKWVGGARQKKAVADAEAVDADADVDVDANANATADASISKANKGKAKAKNDNASERAGTSKSSAKAASSKGKAKERTIVEAVAAANKQATKPKAKASTAKHGPMQTQMSRTTASALLRHPTASLHPKRHSPRFFPPLPFARLYSNPSSHPHKPHLPSLRSSPPSYPRTTCAHQHRKGTTTKPFVKAITAYRTHGKSLQRGEPWSAATELLASLGLTRIPLPFVEHDIPVEVEAAAAQRSPSPPATRVTRARRAKENNQYETARQLSLLDSWEDDEFGGTASEAYDDDEDAMPSKRKRAPPKKSIYVYDDPSDDESMADPDDNARGRRARKPAQKEPAPEVRLTGRQQAIKLQQEEEAKQRKEEEDAANAENEARKRRASTAASSSSKGTISDASDDEEEREKRRAHTNGRSHKKRRRLTAGNSDDEAEPDAEDKDKNGASEDKDDLRTEQDQCELESPDLETKVSIIGALIDAAVMADGVAEELKTAAENIVAMERVQRASHADMEKENVEELAELNKRAPSIVSPEYQKWKAEKQQLEHDIAWRRQEARVIAELAIDTHALRTGSIGHDVDGREYWHLREYQERMPKFTEGRFAWCLVVLGPAFPMDPSQPKEEAKEVEKGEADVSMAEAAGNETKKDETEDDSGLTSLDGTSDNGQLEVEDVKLGLPTSLKAEEAANGASDEAASSRRICMGANNPLTIKTLIEYVTYRLEQVEYEENVGMQEREKEARLAREGPMEKVNIKEVVCDSQAKQMLKETQEERRKQTEQLVKRLNKSKEYFAWHREELAP